LYRFENQGCRISGHCVIESSRALQGVAAADLAKKPADHSSDYVQKQTDGALHWMITEGHTPMPTFKTSLTDNQRWELVNYIRTLAKNKK